MTDPMEVRDAVRKRADVWGATNGNPLHAAVRAALTHYERTGNPDVLNLTVFRSERDHIVRERQNR